MAELYSIEHEVILKWKKYKSNIYFKKKKRKLFHIHATSIKPYEESRKGTVFILHREAETQGR